MEDRSIPSWIGASTIVIAVLVVASSLLGLLLPSVYAREVEDWRLQAWGQDVGNLASVVVLIVGMRLLKTRRSIGVPLWLGALFYVLYAFVIYVFGVHFNELFLLYTAILGLSVFTVVFAIPVLRNQPKVPKGPRVLAGWALVTLGILFALLWLGEIVPALLSGQTPASITDAGLISNPVHVIDLAVVLPALTATGWLTLKDRSWGLFLAGPWLVFAVLMAASVVAGSLFLLADGATEAVVPAVALSVVAIAGAVVAVRLIRALDRSARSA
ncbi:hypothetical protein ARHIZOSPH14_15070 [Agromyces rhizosphaerae]|uniref:Uncharacterized protein n=1 Tax=Agromyces rhizosphaerae TaxID=88374 RepID=A0A9W6CVR9_9MICO|nr:hypothetical protein [Agromyces rhizosphaerae]GLI27265.1 hypothetical protein ARHIZOSPH14_15070 [Agromyces rhizosphaerae]